MKLEKTTISVLELLNTIKSFSLFMNSSNISFIHNIDVFQEVLSKFSIHGDVHKLNQVLRNILSNAIKFTPKGGSISVCVEAFESLSERPEFSFSRFSTSDPQFNQLRISCTDTGPGIAKVRNIINDRFTFIFEFILFIFC